MLCVLYISVELVDAHAYVSRRISRSWMNVSVHVARHDIVFGNKRWRENEKKVSLEPAVVSEQPLSYELIYYLHYTPFIFLNFYIFNFILWTFVICFFFWKFYIYHKFLINMDNNYIIYFDPFLIIWLFFTLLFFIYEESVLIFFFNLKISWIDLFYGKALLIFVNNLV